MLHFVCVKHGQKYGPEFVNILHDMVMRNLLPTPDADFVCFTDDASGLSEGINIRDLPEDVKGWWCKLYLFDAFPDGDRIVYFDLDTVITGQLDEFAAYRGEFAICNDFMGPGWNSSVMLWKSGFGRSVWTHWLEQGKPDLPGGDQEWIERELKQADIIQELWPKSVLSYKMDCMLRYPPKGTVAVCFHGEPKPDNCGVDWVQLLWKMGGGTGAELALVCNTEESRLHDNIKAACSLVLPWLQPEEPHDRHAVIVGGGPSVTNDVEEIRWRKSIGQTIVAINGSHDWLLEHDIQPDYHIVLDARPGNARFVRKESKATRLIASQCDREVFQTAGECVIWQADIEGLDDIIPHEKWPRVIINAGSTVGLCAMAIMFAKGYRVEHLYGLDSSYAESHHAYEQPENDGDRVLDAILEGRTFKAAPWMVAQTNQFQTVANDLAAAGCLITVHGDGLIPWCAKQMELSSAPDSQAVEIDGIWWPSRDKTARPYILNSMGDIEKMLSHTKGRGVAVQAGGNVGLFPRELAKHFKRVYTFEPDPLNFECLTKNAPDVNAMNAALGEEPGTKALARDPSNCGAHYIEDGDEFKVIRLDDTDIPSCDLLQLDVEGYELSALKGGERLIDRCKPTIVVELKGHGSRYGYTDEDLKEWLSAKGYREVTRFGRDVLFSTT